MNGAGLAVKREHYPSTSMPWLSRKSRGIEAVKRPTSG
jgi:hypothetical protein